MMHRTDNLSKSTRVAILSTAFFVSLLLLLQAIWVCNYYISAEAHARYVGVTNVASEKIAKTISGMEMNAMNVFDEVQKHMDSPEAVVDALMSKTSLNPDVRGYFAAFEPEYFPEKGRWFEPYAHQTDSTHEFEITQVGSARHNYTQSDWYMKAKELKASFWSDPYYYYDGTSISGHYCTFVEPIYDAEGKLACVCGADMTFEWLTKELKQIDLESKQDDLLNLYLFNKDQDFYTVVLNGDGSCLAYPEGQKVAIDDEDVLKDLKQRKSGFKKMTINGENATVYYGPIRNINWVTAVIVPAYEVQKPILMIGLTLFIVMLLGMIIIYKLL